MRGRMRSEEKVRFWRKILEEQRKSGLSVREFCRVRGLSTGLFYYWRKSLERNGFGENRERESRKRLIPVRISPFPVGAVAFEIELRNGRRVRVAPGFVGNELRDLINMCEES